MSQRLKDLRDSIKTIEGADAEFQNIALLEIDIAKLEASCEKKLSEIKTDFARSIDGLTVMRDEAVARLAAYVESRRMQFQKPRRRKTAWGTYGLTDASKAQIDDKDKAIDHCISNGWKDCLKNTITLLSKPLRDRLQAGETCPGARLLTGDVAGYTVKKELIDKAIGQKTP